MPENAHDGMNEIRPDRSRNHEFALELGRALQMYGAPAHRLEEAIGDVVRLTGGEGEFFSTPTAIFAQFKTPTEERVHLVRVNSGEADLEKMADLNDLANAVIEGEISTEEGLRRIEEITSAPPRYGRLLTTLSFGLTSSAASRFFGAGPVEMGLAFCAGLGVGLLALLASKVAFVGRLFDPLSGFVVSMLAILLASVFGPASVPIVTVAGLIVLVPGLTLTVAVTELAQKNLISGSARLHGALTVFLMLGFGVAFGAAVASLVTGPLPAIDPVPAGTWTEAIAIFVASLTLTILFRAHPRDFPHILIACSLTYLTVRLASPAFGPELGVFLGALVAGTLSNLFTRLIDRPAAIVRLPSMMLLVPGGLGFLSISSLMNKDVMAGMETAFSVALLAVALVTGLLVANAILPPVKRL